MFPGDYWHFGSVVLDASRFWVFFVSLLFSTKNLLLAIVQQILQNGHKSNISWNTRARNDSKSSAAWSTACDYDRVRSLRNTTIVKKLPAMQKFEIYGDEAPGVNEAIDDIDRFEKDFEKRFEKFPE